MSASEWKELHWRSARNQWRRKVKSQQIADDLEITVSGFRNRIRQFRKDPETADWFPARDHNCNII